MIVFKQVSFRITSAGKVTGLFGLLVKVRKSSPVLDRVMDINISHVFDTTSIYFLYDKWTELNCNIDFSKQE